MANIITTVGAEKNCRMTNARFARQPIASVFSGWNVLRVALRIRLQDTGAAYTGPPNFAVGLCSGNTNIMGDALPTHFAGIMSDKNQALQVSWARSAVTTNHYGAYFFPVKQVGAAYTQGATQFATICQMDASNYKLFFVEITKGSPYSFNPFFATSASAVDATNADFLAQSVAAGGGAALANHAYPGPQTLAVNEGANGTFDNACCWWDQTLGYLDVCEFEVFKVS